MKLVVLTYGKCASFRFSCACGWKSPVRYTLEAAGRDADVHMAERFPIGTLRRPCDEESIAALKDGACHRTVGAIS
jgi:hypothetical protein